MTAPRYAIYHAPAVDSPWWRFGATWLGWDECRGVALQQPRWPEWSGDAFHALTAEPRRYGFHATLKAPFRLTRGVNEEMLCERVNLLASRLHRVPLGSLVLARIDDFIALVPTQGAAALAALAARCVRDLDDLRAPLTAQEIERRHPEHLGARERAHLERWGYPWVMDLFRLHMTLSGPVEAATGERIIRRATEALAELQAAHPPVLDRMCVFREDGPGAPFARIHDAELLP